MNATQTIIYIPREGQTHSVALSVQRHLPGRKRPALMIGNEFCGHLLATFRDDGAADEFIDHMRALAALLDRAGMTRKES